MSHLWVKDKLIDDTCHPQSIGATYSYWLHFYNLTAIFIPMLSNYFLSIYHFILFLALTSLPKELFLEIMHKLMFLLEGKQNDK